MMKENITHLLSHHQDGGRLFIDGEDGTTIVIRPENTMALLSTVLTALRIEGDTEKLRACALTCMAHLGRGRFLP